MSSLHRALGRPEPLPLDNVTLRRIERLYRRLEPDPLFRRRLRGEVVNRYVAVREGYLRQPRPRREMGRLGRAVLYASLALAMSVSAAGAAAERALPGDLLYGVKLQLEDVRMRVAPPSIRDDLAAMALAERIGELEQVAAAGSWSLVSAAAERVTEAEAALAALDPAAGGASASHALAALEAVLVTAPPQAQASLNGAVAAVTSHARPASAPPATQHHVGAGREGRSAAGQPAAGWSATGLGERPHGEDSHRGAGNDGESKRGKAQTRGGSHEDGPPEGRREGAPHGEGPPD